MIERIHFIRRLFVAGCLFLLSVPAFGAPDYLRFYKAGVAAAETGDWSQAETLMRRALTEKSEEKKGWAVFRKGYFPQYYLGVARYHQGDCTGALQAWAESENQGAIIDREPYSELLRLRSDCKKNGKPTPGSGAQPLESSKKETSGKEKVRTGQHWVEKSADPAQRTLGAIEKVAPGSELGKAAHQSQQVLQVAQAATDIVDLALPPAQALEAAIDAFFAGNPEQTLRLLRGIDLTDPRARAQVYLFRSAASFRLHLLAGGDAGKLAAARESANLFRQERWRSDFRPQFFDPRFVRFLQSGN